MMGLRTSAPPMLSLLLASALLLAEAQHMRGSNSEAAQSYGMRETYRAPQGESRFKDLAKFQGKTRDFRGRAGQDQFMSLCQQLGAAQEAARNGQRQDLEKMEKQGYFVWLSEMCPPVKTHDGKKVAEFIHQQKEALGEAADVMKQHLATHTTGDAVALGCTALLKAKNDGKMQWFESQGWYKKAMQTCMSLSLKSPTQGGTFEATPMELMKESCEKLSYEKDIVRQKKWFSDAERICSTVQSSGPEELKALIRRQENQAESASGQLLKKTCEGLKHDHFKSMADETESWYVPANPWFKMCSKFATKVKGYSLQKRCQWLQDLKKTGKAQFFEKAPWYSRLNKACSWVQHRDQGSKTPSMENIDGSVLV